MFGLLVAGADLFLPLPSLLLLSLGLELAQRCELLSVLLLVTSTRNLELSSI
jgi:hypothetical protein